MRALHRLLAGLVVLLALLGGLFGLLRSEAGGALAARLAMQAVPGLRLDGLRLALPWELAVEHLELADAEGVWLTLYEARLAIEPAALWHGEARIAELAARRLAIARAPAAPPGAAPAAPPTRVLPALPRLPLVVTLESLTVERLELGSPLAGQRLVFEADGAARLAAGSATARLALERLNGVGTVRLEATLAPAEDRLNATLTLREDGDGLIPARLGRPGEPVAVDLALDGPADGAALRLQARLGTALEATARGTVAATPGGDFAAVLQGEARLEGLLPPGFAAVASPLAMTLEARLEGSRQLRLPALRLRAPAGELGLAGTLDLADETLDLALEARLGAAAALAPGLPPGLAWQALAAQARLGGTLAAPRLEASLRPAGLRTGEARLDAALGPAPELTVQAQLPGPVVTARLQGAALEATLAGQLGADLDAALRLAVPRLGVIEPTASGRLVLEASAKGPRADPAVALRLTAAQLGYAGRRLDGLEARLAVEHALSAPAGRLTASGRLDGLPLSVALDARPEPAGLRIGQGEAQLGPARLTLSGLLTRPGNLFDGSAALRVEELAAFAGLLGQPDLAGPLDAEARLAAGPEGQGIEARLRAPRLRLLGQEGRVVASASGRAADLRLGLEAEGGAGQLAMQGRLTQRDATQTLEIAALRAQWRGQGLALLAPARLQRDARGDLALAPADFALGSGRLRLEGRSAGETLEGRATLHALPLALAEPLLPAVAPRGTVAGEVRLAGTLAKPEVTARLTGTELTAAGPAYRGLPKLGIAAEARLSGDQGQLRATIEAGPAGQVLVTARLPTGYGSGARLTATADGRVDIGVLAAPLLAAGADRLSGGLRLGLRLEGPIAAPRLGGAVQLEGITYRNAVSGLRLTDIGGTIRGEGERLRLEGVQARMPGGGTIQLAGTLTPFATGLPADLRLTARNARPPLGELGTAQFDADLTLRGPVLGAGLLAGEIRVARADLRVPETLPTQVPTLEPVRYVGRPPPGVVLAQPAAAVTALPPLRLALRLRAPSQIFVRGRGIDVELGGDIAVAGTLVAPEPSGGLRLRQGRLDILGRRLEFKRGSIAFRAGTLEPELDLLAEATTRGTTVSVAVQGPPSAPEIILSAMPELPPDEVMARLLFDRASSTLSPFEIAQIAQGIAQLTGVGGGFDPLGRARDLLGLNRLGVAAAPEGQTGAALEAGKYLAPGVYVGVRQGVQGGQPGVAVQVELAPSLKLEGQTATGPAGDRVGVTWEYEY